MVKNALDKAAEAEKNALEKLDAKNPAAAKPDQKEALKALEEAKAALDQQAKNIEDRRAEIAKANASTVLHEIANRNSPSRMN